MARRRPTLLAVAGARPNFVKLAPLVRAARAARLDLPWVHTGQHYDPALSDGFLRGLGLPEPELSLEIGPGSPAAQTARILERLEPVLLERRPAALVVVGDVTSTLAAALAASHAGVRVVHVEAGLRSFDESMPEERNRILVDRLAARLYVTEPSGMENLAREGVPARRCRLVGNPMIDALRTALDLLRGHDPAPDGEALVTLHRPSNVDDPKSLRRWCDALGAIARTLPVRFTAHPRTRARLEAAGLDAALADAGVTVVEPMPYLGFLNHLRAAQLVLTDSGGVQEEASFLGVPCLTLRTSTERPITVTHGTNRVIGDDPRVLPREVARTLRRPPVPRPPRRLWDGRASERILADLRRFV